VSTVDAESRTTTVDVSRDVTYRDFGRVLDVLERGASWKQLQTPRPPGVAPGFLTALDQMMRSSAASAGEVRTAAKVPRLTYVYKDAVYDLIARRVERVPQLRTHSRTFQNLLRTDLSVRNRATGVTTDFRVAYGTEGSLSGVPVYAQYQPNWWFKVELELDDRGEAPEDPASALSFRQRIDALCGRSRSDPSPSLNSIAPFSNSRTVATAASRCRSSGLSRRNRTLWRKASTISSDI
jgi:hypothetical protein